MQKIEYKKMFDLENNHFWFVGKRHLIDVFLSPYKDRVKSILDLGSGTGGTTKHLKKYGCVTGIENNNYSLHLAKKRGIHILKGDVNHLNLKPESFDLVTLLDVLYHKNIKDEEMVIKNIWKVLKKNKYLLITDSAFIFLKSHHDIATQGKRRFTIKDIAQMLERNGFEILRASYIYFFLFPLVFLKRFFVDRFLKDGSSDVKPVGSFINTLLLSIIRIEAKILQYVSFPIGSSVIILAIKNERFRENIN